MSTTVTSNRSAALVAALALPLVARAREYAIKAHEGQKYGEADYVVHLDMVAALVAEVTLNSTTLAAAYLHDVEEDNSQVTRQGLRAEFSVAVEDIVYRCTGEGESRTEKQKAIVRKLGDDEQAILVKLCDRVCNMEHSLKYGQHSLLVRYRKEMPLYDTKFSTSAPALYARFLACA